MPTLGLRGCWRPATARASHRRTSVRACAHRAPYPAIEWLEPRHILSVQLLSIVQVSPSLWSIYEGQVTDTVAAANVSADYTFSLQAGQTLSFSTHADTVLETFTLTDPGGNVLVNNSAAPGVTA